MVVFQRRGSREWQCPSGSLSELVRDPCPASPRALAALESLSGHGRTSFGGPKNNGGLSSFLVIYSRQQFSPLPHVLDLVSYAFGCLICRAFEFSMAGVPSQRLGYRDFSRI